MFRKYDKPIHLNMDLVTFSMLTSDDIRKLSVTRVITSNVLDNLGHPLPGGLYDLAMGPMSEHADPCATCYQNIFTCPGHFGHIELPLPTVNPLFHKLIPVLLRVSCLNCYAIQLPELFKKILITQLKLLNCGLITEADEIESRMLSLLAKHDSLETIPEDAGFSIGYYEKLIEKRKQEGNITPTRNSELLLGETLNNAFKEVKARKACMYCKAPMFTRIQCLRNRIMMVTNQLAVRGSSAGIVEKKANTKNVTPEESRQYLRKIWQVEQDLLLEVIPLLKDIKIDYPTDVFFFDVIPVTPPSMRPVAIVGDVVREGIQNVTYKNIINSSVIVKMILAVSKNRENLNKLSADAKAMYNATRGETPIEKLNYAWEELQRHVDTLLDSDLRLTMNERMQGLKQLIEKKTGIIRLHMMGKRVNFAGRSVITPDPNLNIDEIGVPEAFAKQLVYAVPVTHWNVEELRKMIMNGPDVHPGAVMIKNEDGKVVKINPRDKTQQESILKRLLTPGVQKQGFRGVKVVYRHMCNGDIMLVNRQPTLHKPSIMAHTARILKGEKTLRLHYANCKGYNADFDGDEMNVHFPQGELARSEGYLIANVCNQYLVPKDGTPLSGLIQDYVIAGSKLSMRGRFFTKTDYQHFVFQGLSHQVTEIKLLPPAILKPAPLWSGKQILSTIILNVIPEGKEPFNLTATSKIPARAWQIEKARPWKAGGAPFKNPNDMTEAEVVVRQGELLAGILDKTHYGSTPFGLVHCVYELYGGVIATKLLNAFGKLFLNFLKTEGFTLGVHDILIQSKPDKKRKKIIEESRKVGKLAVTKALELPADTPNEEIVRKIEENSHKNSKIRAMIDREYKSLMDGYTNEINKTCLPAGLICKFPHNNLQFMVQSGAKGSTVNTMQISCLLGQIELEGKRPPVMISGKSLPSFPAFEFSPRAGGFIDGRFMTGIQPQEFFFHCMAGREGLIDTAVKTSRSGYLQRCLIKHLEGLTVNYDLTVRDSDKNVIQFSYGDDGMDVTKAQFLRKKQMGFLADNCKVIIDKKTIKQLKKVEDYEKLDEHIKKISEWKKQHGDPLQHRRQSAFTKFSQVISDKLESIPNVHKIHKDTGREKMALRIVDLWRQADDALKERLNEETKRCPDTPYSLFQPDVYFGSLSDSLMAMMEEFGGKQDAKKEKKEFEDMLKLKSMKSLCCPGEPVGMLAAQSVGEPSTQMTLNTFHFAGRGEMNVTLGIPRLREILMEASRFIKTPSMEVPFLDVPNLEVEAEKLKKTLTRVVVADVLEKIDVTSRLEISPHRQQRYTMRFHFLPHKCYKSQYCVKPKRILKHMNKKFFGEMFSVIRKIANAESKMIVMEGEKRKAPRKRKDDDEDDDAPEPGTPERPVGLNDGDGDSSEEEPEDTEDAKLANKYQQKHDAGEPEEEDKEPSDAGEEVEKEDTEEEGAGAKENEQQADDEKEVKEMQDAVLNTYKAADGYSYDTKHHLWCELSFAIPLTMKKIDMSNVLKEVAKKSVIWETPHIRRAITYEKNGRLTLRTDGINFHEIFKYNELLDLNKLYSNDIHKIAETYGIEAATRVIVKEVRDVFGVYGITVDQRHLSLIADYMTCSGAFVPLNRAGMDTSASAMQQMSFESSLAFLRNAVIRGKQDLLQNPSSCLMVGKPCKTGTGSFDLLHRMPIFKQ